MDVLKYYFAIVVNTILKWISWVQLLNFRSQVLVVLFTTLFFIGLISLLFKKTEYSLSISLFDTFNQSDWDDVEDVSDLVVGQFFPVRTESKKLFLLSYIEDESLTVAKRSTQWCLNFYLCLNEIQSKNILQINDIINQVNEHIMERLSQAIVNSREKCKVFFEEHAHLQQNVVKPMADLTSYKNPNGCINVVSFLADLSKQITSNLGGLDKIDTVAKMKPSLVNLCVIIRACIKHNYNIGNENTEMIKQIYAQLSELKNVYKEIIEFMQYRYEQSENSLSGINVDIFKSKLSVLYFRSHEEALVEAFSHLPKEFPFKIPNIISQTENLLEIRNLTEYLKVKNTYNDLEKLSMRFEKIASMTWPAFECLPNFSTHDFKPRISIGTVEDFELVLNMYSDYLKRLDLLKQGWATSLRSIINTTETMDPFIKNLAI